MSSKFTLLPAVDISGGKSVRLSQGQNEEETKVGSPLELVEEYVSSGATWIHLADIDQAFGRGNNQRLISQIITEYPSIKFQVSGGIKDHTTFQTAADTGAQRINISSVALSEKQWLSDVFQMHQNQVSFALDVKEGEVVPRGSQENFGNLDQVLDFLVKENAPVYVVTDILRDGMLSGPNLDLLKKVIEFTCKPVFASGGIASLDDLDLLMNIPGLSGAVLGKALINGNFSFVEAIDLVGEK